MKIDILRMRNFRKFENSTFRFHLSFTVLIGDNGSGKTSIPDAMAIMPGTYLLRFRTKSA